MSSVEETPSVGSQESDTGISSEMKELAVEDQEKENEEKSENSKENDEKPKRETSKRKRTSRGTESPAKKPKEKSTSLSKSSSMSSLASTNGASNGVRQRGRPRRSLNPTMKVPEEPVAEAFKLETQPRGVLLAFGMGDAGQLGMGEDVMERKKPQPVKEIEDKVICAAAGGMHNVYVTEKGEVFTFGCNDEGALGRKTEEEEDCMITARVNLDDKAVSCSAGDSHTAILTEDGSVWLWGTFRDANGRLGMKSTDENKDGEGEKAVLKEPTKLDIPTKILRMASGCDHLLLLDISGQVYSLGCAESGQLGRLSSHFCQKGGRRGADKVLSAATIQLKKVTRKTGRVIDVACGQYSSFLVTESGQVIGFGLNNCYQMGYHDREVRYTPEVIPIKENGENVKIKKIASGMHHTLFLSESGDVYTVGCGDYGRLGVGQKDKLRESKKVLKVSLPKPAINVGCGSCTSYAILDDSKAMAWGMGSNLQLTNGSEDDEWEPIKMAGKQIDDKKILKVSGGGQHAILLIDASED